MKKFVLLHYGFEKPTPEIMAAWGKWFEGNQAGCCRHGRLRERPRNLEGRNEAIFRSAPTSLPASRLSMRQVSTTREKIAQATLSFRAFGSTK